MDPATLAIGAVAIGSGIGWARARRRAQAAQRRIVRLRAQRDEARELSTLDELTGLLNRRAFTAEAEPLVARPIRPSVLVFVDVDRFKDINDQRGHGIGDRVLIATARRLHRFAGEHLVARLAGDEFVMLLISPRGSTGWDWLHPTAAVLAETLAGPVKVAGQRIPVSASLGLAPIHGPAPLAQRLAEADAAMYRAKTSGTRAATFDPVLDAERIGRTGSRPRDRQRDSRARARAYAGSAA